jgi:hypothetical protein
MPPTQAAKGDERVVLHTTRWLAALAAIYIAVTGALAADTPPTTEGPGSGLIPQNETNVRIPPVATLWPAPNLPLYELPRFNIETPAERAHDLRVKKARIIVLAFYNHVDRHGNPTRANFLPYCEYLVTTHERLEAEGLRKLALAVETNDKAKIREYKHSSGYGGAWYWSLVYGGANFSLRCHARAPGLCAGPMDVKSTSWAQHERMVADTEANILWHCEEMWGFWKDGVRGRDLCEYVFYPHRPHDWGGGRFQRTDNKHRERLLLAYSPKLHKLP